MQNHGVSNAYFLSVRRTTSKAQQEIIDHLNKTHPELGFVGEQLFYANSRRFFIDAMCEKLKLVVEYNGDYWHCNPLSYDGTFFHPKKKKTATEIWKEDEQRMEALREAGYKTIVVWERDYVRNKDKVIDELERTISDLVNEAA